MLRLNSFPPQKAIFISKKTDDGSMDKTNMLKISLDSMDTLTMSPGHLIWKMGAFERWEKVKGSDLIEGDLLHAKGERARIVKIERTISEFRSILTRSRNIIVNGVSAGAYAPPHFEEGVFSLNIEKNDRFIGNYYAFFMDAMEWTGLFDLNDPVYGYYAKKIRYILSFSGLWGISVFFVDSLGLFSFLSFVASLPIIGWVSMKAL